MKNKILISALMLLLLTVLLCSNTFATNNMMDSARNALNNMGNAIGSTANKTKDTIVNGTESLTNGAEDLTNDTINGTTMYGNETTNYTATRTATDSLIASNNMMTWLILGVVGAIIVGLIWYYGAQFEHRNYNND